MKGNLTVYYDEEGDFLEFHIGKFTEGSFKNLGQGVFERTDEQGKSKALLLWGSRHEHVSLRI